MIKVNNQFMTVVTDEAVEGINAGHDVIAVIRNSVSVPG
ncbi:hypothetical protein SAMN04487934_101616 [Eubacterium ruminantium]|nr:hypothetical protein SAMN04487934_101616 [Eubacterium ruminantium]